MSNYTIKDYKIGGYYHLRLESDATDLFVDDSDMQAFERLLRGSLQDDAVCDKPCFAEDICLISCCLTEDHCHLLVYLHWMNGAIDLVEYLRDAYALYYYDKYGYGRSLWRKKIEAIELKSSIEVAHVLEHIRRHVDATGSVLIENSSSLDLPLLRPQSHILNSDPAEIVAEDDNERSVNLDYLCIDVLPQGQRAAESIESVI